MTIEYLPDLERVSGWAWNSIHTLSIEGLMFGRKYLLVSKGGLYWGFVFKGGYIWYFTVLELQILRKNLYSLKLFTESIKKFYFFSKFVQFSMVNHKIAKNRFDGSYKTMIFWRTAWLGTQETKKFSLDCPAVFCIMFINIFW